MWSSPRGTRWAGTAPFARLHRALYGLRQAPRAWHQCLKRELEQLGFAEADADPGLFVLDGEAGRAFLLVYVDDMLVAAPTLAAVKEIKAQIAGAFDAHDLGEATALPRHDH